MNVVAATIILVSLLQTPLFDMQGTIIRFNFPSSMVIGNETADKTVLWME